MTTPPSLLHDRRGSGTVQKLILILVLSLGAVVGVRALTDAVKERGKCAGEEIKTLVAGAGPCFDNGPPGDPSEPRDPPPDPPEPGEGDPEFDAAKELIDLAAELIGFNDAKRCVMEGDILACVMTVLNFTPGRIFGLLFKIGKNLKRIKKAIDDFLDARNKKKKADEACQGDACDGNVCFAPGTKVHTETGPVAIEEVRAGDRVWSRDDETGEEGYRPVVRTFVTPDQPLLAVAVEDESGAVETIEATAEHPFHVEGRGWVAAGELRANDRLVGADGRRLRVADARATERTTTVYNLEVEEFHTYFVGESAAWVHNQCKKEEKKPKKKRGEKKVNEKCKKSDECAVGYCHKKKNGDQVCVNCSEKEMKDFQDMHDNFCTGQNRSCLRLDVNDTAPGEFSARAAISDRCVQARKGEHKRCFGGEDVPGMDHPNEIKNAATVGALCKCLADVASNAGLDRVNKETFAKACRAKFSRPSGSP